MAFSVKIQTQWGWRHIADFENEECAIQCAKRASLAYKITSAISGHAEAVDLRRFLFLYMAEEDPEGYLDDAVYYGEEIEIDWKVNGF